MTKLLQRGVWSLPTTSRTRASSACCAYSKSSAHRNVKRYARDPVTMLAPPALKTVHPPGESPVIDDDGTVVAQLQLRGSSRERRVVIARQRIRGGIARAQERRQAAVAGSGRPKRAQGKAAVGVRGAGHRC